MASTLNCDKLYEIARKGGSFCRCENLVQEAIFRISITHGGQVHLPRFLAPLGMFAGRLFCETGAHFWDTHGGTV